MKKNVLKACLLIFITISLMACGPVQMPITNTYVIKQVPENVPHRRKHAGTLLVLAPQTRPAFNSTQIAYSTVPYKLAYFGRTQWAENPSEMLTPILVQAFENTGYFHAVVTQPYTGRFSYFLTTEITDLREDFTRTPVSMVVTIRAQLANATGSVIAIDDFTATAPIYQITPYNTILAANQATAEVVRKIVAFSLRKI